MIHLFDDTPPNTIEEFLSKRTLLAFDFDGTLAPIVDNRDVAQMRATTLARFTRSCELYDCAIITGRSHHDVTPRLGSAHVWRTVGNHGQETFPMKNVASTELNEVVRYLKRELSGVNGVEIEHKGLSLAIHYRNAIDSQQALRAIQAVVLHLPVEMRQVGGKSVLNLLPKDAPHKGDALRALREESGAIRALYVGDDVTDEDVFKIRQPSWLLTVRIGSFVQSDATYYLHEQSEIDRLLDALILFKTGFKMNTSSGKAR